MTRYRYTVSTTTTAQHFSSKRAAIAAARAEAKAGRMADVWKMLLDDAGNTAANLGRIYTSFPATHD